MGTSSEPTKKLGKLLYTCIILVGLARSTLSTCTYSHADWIFKYADYARLKSGDQLTAPVCAVELDIQYCSDIRYMTNAFISKCVCICLHVFSLYLNAGLWLHFACALVYICCKICACDSLQFVSPQFSSLHYSTYCSISDLSL